MQLTIFFEKTIMEFQNLNLIVKFELASGSQYFLSTGHIKNLSIIAQ